jgi:hypothetical protein
MNRCWVDLRPVSSKAQCPEKAREWTMLGQSELGGGVKVNTGASFAGRPVKNQQDLRKINVSFTLH